MKRFEHDEQVINNYQEQEKMMILIYAQWCINHQIDPISLYQEAYPDQLKNDTLEEVLELTVSRQESDEISHETVIQALQAFGNDDLAFVVQQKMDILSKNNQS